MSWNASTDAAGIYTSGVAGYRVYRNGNLATTTSSLSWQDTGRTAGTTYSYTVASYDNAGNASAQSVAVQATTFSATNPPPVWQPSNPITLEAAVANVEKKYGLAQYVSDPDLDTLTFDVVSPPAGISINSTTGALTVAGTVAQGTYDVVVGADDGYTTAEQDWSNRSTATGVIQAFDFRDPADVTIGCVGGRGIATQPENVTRYTGDGVTGGACLRIAIPASSWDDPGSWKCFLNRAWNSRDITQMAGSSGIGMGATEFYVQYRLKIDANWLVLAPGTGNEGKKVGIVSTGFHSNTLFEHVIQDQLCRNIVQAYRRTGGILNQDDYAQFLEGYGGGDYKPQNSIPAPYCLYSTDGSGYPNCYRFTPNVWMCFYQRIRVQSYGGSSGNIYELSAWKPGESGYTRLMSHSNYVVGFDDRYPLGFSGLQLTPFTSGRTPTTIDSYALYDHVIVSTQPIACPTV